MLIAGNWKMNGGVALLDELAAIAAKAADTPQVDVAIFPPFTLIAPAVAQAGTVIIGGQDCHQVAAGAYTGSTSASMLVDAGATQVLCGHSERRAGFGETNQMVRAKAETALAAGLHVVICVGENRADRDNRRAGHVVGAQLDGSVPPSGTAETMVVAYEPAWAIGSGRTPTAAEISGMHDLIRAKLIQILGEDGACVRILYGGSVSPANAAEILGIPDVDGALVGGASLTAADFVPIITAAANVSQ
ncbi:triose-phosphate isomerase [uncultured Sphingomonas sp.]|uniref:triose-phosphate isomerase n=1 Tax=uncultured Sphingomonas sp. TaxID=158754 RepID=UPI0025F49F72|nr:triose-phosphate isomerase [uncultured Sphingomonas sp.]